MFQSELPAIPAAVGRPTSASRGAVMPHGAGRVSIAVECERAAARAMPPGGYAGAPDA